jgi:hypothetical protein
MFPFLKKACAALTRWLAEAAAEDSEATVANQAAE